MAGDVQVLTGDLVAAVSRTYQSFTDRETKEVRPGGVTYSVFVSTGFDSPPVEVKVSDPAVFGELARAGFGALVEVTCELSARNNRISRRATKAEQLVRPPSGVPSAAHARAASLTPPAR